MLDKSAQYKVLTDKWGKRLIDYEGGQDQLDPDDQARIEAVNHDPAMETFTNNTLPIGRP